jgi:predicted permease
MAKTLMLSDVHLALRGWRRAPVFTAIAILSIALGIGATTAIFTLVDQVLLRTLPIEDPQALVQTTSAGPKVGNTWGDGTGISFPMYQDLRDNNQVFTGMCGQFNFNAHIGYHGQTERVAGELVTGTYFPVLGVGAAIGRVLLPEDDRQRGGHPVAVLSHGFWVSRFAADPTVVGRPIVINGSPYTIVGVSRAGFEGIELGRPTRVFVPMMMKAQITTNTGGSFDTRRFSWVRVFARLRPGVSAEQAQAAMQPFFRSRLQMEVQEPDFANTSPRVKEQFLASTISLLPGAQGRSGFRRNLTRPLWVLMAIAAGVLIIACANVANLLLARGAGRQREIAIRLALGASRTRLVRQLLTESVLLAAAGGLAGLAIAAAAAPIVLAFFVAPGAPQPVSTMPDLRILGFTFGVSLLTGVIFGLAPALQSTRPDVAPTLKDQAGAVLGGGQGRLRKGLVASQMAVSLLLLIGAGLFIRTLNNLLTVDIGMSAHQLIAFSIDPSLNGYTPERTKQFAQSILERLTNMPGVTSVAIGTQPPLGGNRWMLNYTIEGYTPTGDELPDVLTNAVSPNYFETMGIALLTGRDFDARDVQMTSSRQTNGSFRAAIVNERFVKEFFGTANPIGRHVGFGGGPGTPTPVEIVGVVKNATYTDVRDETQAQIFLPYFEQSQPRPITAFVRTTREAETMFRVLRETMRELDPNLPMHSTRTLESQIAQSLSRERLLATMSAVFGMLATLLAVIGLYGVMAYTVSRRTREIGIRMALGARVQAIGWLVIREVLSIAAIGVAVGLPAAWFLGRYVASQLYGVQPTDPLTIAGAVLMLAAVATIAGLIPSIRATRVSPTTALRYE